MSWKLTLEVPDNFVLPARHLTPVAIEDLLEQELPDDLRADLETLLTALVGDQQTGKCQ